MTTAGTANAVGLRRVVRLHELITYFRRGAMTNLKINDLPVAEELPVKQLLKVRGGMAEKAKQQQAPDDHVTSLDPRSDSLLGWFIGYAW